MKKLNNRYTNFYVPNVDEWFRYTYTSIPNVSKEELKGIWEDDRSLDNIQAGIYDGWRENSNYVQLLEHFGIRKFNNNQILKELIDLTPKRRSKTELEVYPDDKPDQKPYYDVAIWDINSEVKQELFDLSKDF